jgi:type VI secretion system secreted protein VgrG
MLQQKYWYQDLLRQKREAFANPNAIGHDFFLRLGALQEQEIRVAAFHGAEALNELYQFDVVFSVSAVDALRVREMLGHDACLRIPYPGMGARLVLGVASVIELLEPREDHVGFRVAIVPRLWTLGRTKRSRVYQNLTTAQIVTDVLARYGVPHLMTLTQQYAPREYCLQYDETDLDFVMRLLADEGFVFAFEHWDAPDAQAAGFSRATECLLIADDVRLYTSIAKAPPALQYIPDANDSPWADEPVVRLIHRGEIATNVVTLRDFDFERAGPGPGVANPSPTASTVAPLVWNGAFTMVDKRPQTATPVDLEVYDHRAEERPPGQDPRRPHARLDQLRRHVDVYSGVSWSRRLAPGKRFRVLDYGLAAPPEIVITRVVHASHDSSGRDVARFTNEFEAVPADVLWRPEARPRRFVQAVETATVVGPPGQDLNTDLHGRVKIQFHWDREGKNDEHSSCWIRVTQPWSGPTYGFQFVPRTGSEVLVAFVGGDPDHPVVIGSLPNTANRLPHLLPQDASRSAIRSFSTPSTGGYNEILFNDRAGGEVLSLRAEKDHAVEVLNDHRVDVGHDATTIIAERRSARVGGDDDVTVAGNARRAVAGVAVDTVGGLRADQVGGAATLSIGGAWTVAVGGVVEYSVGGSLRTVVGVSEEADALTSVNGEYRVAGSKLIELHSAETIRFIVGNSVLELTPKGISLKADNLDLAVAEAFTTKSKTIAAAAKETHELQGKKLTAASDGASLVLDPDAWLDGANVYLNCKGIKPKPIEDGPPPKKGKVTFKVDPPPGMKGPFTMVISTPTGKIVELETDGDDKVQLDGLEGEEFTLVAIKKGAVVLGQHGGKS